MFSQSIDRSAQRSRKTRVSFGLGAALALTASLAVGMPATQADAQQMIGVARQLQGPPVASQAVRARFAWGAGGNRIIWVNQADEVYYHRVHPNRVDRHIRMRGHTVGVRGDTTEYVIPWGTNRMLVVTQQGSLYSHTIRAESVGPPEQIPGAPVGTQGQDPVFMFKVQNRLINVTQQGEVWAHTVGRTVSPPVRLGRVAIAAPRQVRHVFNLGRSVFIISDQGEVYRHDVHPSFGRGSLVRASTTELGRPATRFVFPLGNGLYAVNEQGTIWRHDITRLVQATGGRRGRTAPTPAPAQ